MHIGDYCNVVRHSPNDDARPKMPFPSNVVVSDTSLKSSDPYDIVGSNVDFLNAQLAEHLRHDELSLNGLRSYYVDCLQLSMGP
jgi:hypothetical protein